MKDYTFKLSYNRPTAADTYEMELITEETDFFETFVPGQFLHVKVPGAPQLLLRRPISVHGIDAAKGSVLLQYALKGEGTRALSEARPGQQVLAAGPLGNGFVIGEEQKIWLLGGGIGVAPLYSVAQAYQDRQIRAFMGWRSKEQLFDVERFEELCDLTACTDDGSYGYHGFAIDALLKALEEETPDLICACGPLPLFRALQKKLPAEVPCRISLEERMGCGIGACLVCACGIKTKDGLVRKRVCADGPVFDLQEVDLG
jgi:dihydroorotate dehydrogenase electron transfer subunit